MHSHLLLSALKHIELKSTIIHNFWPQGLTHYSAVIIIDDRLWCVTRHVPLTALYNFVVNLYI